MLPDFAVRPAPRGYKVKFQRAPTLGGECYGVEDKMSGRARSSFNGHPPLGVNATTPTRAGKRRYSTTTRFNGHPPLGVNATRQAGYVLEDLPECEFQRAPTLGGECYTYTQAREAVAGKNAEVSTGTHPWG